MNEVHKIIAEGRALTRALAVIEAGASPFEARDYCLRYLDDHEANDLEAVVIDCALRKICGLEQPTYSTAHFELSDSLEGVILQEGVVRWLEWASDVAISLTPLEGTKRVSEFDRIALTQWFEGVENLRRGNTTDGRRYFRRAATLSSSYGTRSNPVIQWTYAASFFPE